jgi:hypothetical protein
VVQAAVGNAEVPELFDRKFVVGGTLGIIGWELEQRDRPNGHEPEITGRVG